MSLDGGRQLISVPYSHEINDKPVFERLHRTADEFRDMICRQFDVLYREGAESGRVMAIALHPYLTGVPHRIDALRRRARLHLPARAGVEGDRQPRSRDTIARRSASHKGVDMVMARLLRHALGALLSRAPLSRRAGRRRRKR